jgi:putative ATP-binding cassette transporter
MPGPSRDAWQRFWSIARPFWVSEERGVARGQLVLLVALLVAQTGFSVLYVGQSGEFTSALAARDADRFTSTITGTLLALALSIPVWAFTAWVRDRLALRWRRWLTDRFLSAYVHDRRYYRIGVEATIDNPDQRIADDINTLTQQSLWFLTIALGALMQLVAFTGVLWRISPVLLAVVIGYAIVGNVVTTGTFARRLVGLNFEQIRREADARFGLVRIREHAEPIALLHGEPWELAAARGRFARAFENLTSVIRAQLGLGFFQFSFSFFALVLPTIVVAPSVLAGELEVGRAVEATGAFAAMLAALTIVVSYFSEISKFVAGVERLEALERVLFADDGTPRRGPVASADGEATPGGRIETCLAPQLALDALTVKTPGGERTLVRDLSLVVERGAGLLVVGASGVGKTSLLRAITGLWTTGSGTISRPRREHLVYLAQQPYLVLGTLRDQLLYPLAARAVVPDADLLDALAKVHLAELAPDTAALDVVRDWAKLLSVGEQQRLAFARVLIAEPHYALLDEATSAVDQPTEARLYRALTDAHITPVSVSHHTGLVGRHAHVLALTGDGGWRHVPAGEFDATGIADGQI